MPNGARLRLLALTGVQAQQAGLHAATACTLALDWLGWQSATDSVEKLESRISGLSVCKILLATVRF